MRAKYPGGKRFNSDATKLVKISIRRIRILTSMLMRMQIEAFILLLGTQCIGLGQLND